MKTKTDVIVHPVRLRIIVALTRSPRTAAELERSLGDVPLPSIYRHLAILRDGGIIAEEDGGADGTADSTEGRNAGDGNAPVPKTTSRGTRRKRGPDDRRYRVVDANVGADDAASMTIDQHRVAFATFAASLIDATNRALDSLSDPSELITLPFGYHVHPVAIAPEHIGELSRELQALFERYRTAERASNDSQEGANALFATIVIPQPEEDLT